MWTFPFSLRCPALRDVVPPLAYALRVCLRGISHNLTRAPKSQDSKNIEISERREIPKIEGQSHGFNPEWVRFAPMRPPERAGGGETIIATEVLHGGTPHDTAWRRSRPADAHDCPWEVRSLAAGTGSISTTSAPPTTCLRPTGTCVKGGDSPPIVRRPSS
jgi:hypothetical protein